jgi:hypothetical protein
MNVCRCRITPLQLQEVVNRGWRVDKLSLSVVRCNESNEEVEEDEIRVTSKFKLVGRIM